ncbi:MAG: MBL fold metallo-hydrolase [Pseudomonadota bacterium]
MFLRVTAIAALAASSAAAGAQNFTVTNTDKAKALIDAAVAAHGGDALLRDLETLVIEQKTTNHAVGQSLAARPPWDTNESEGFSAISLDDEIFVTRNKGAGGGFENHTGTIINGDLSYQLNFRAGTAAPIAAPDFANASGPFVRVTPALLIRTLKDREANAHYLGRTEADGESFEVLGFSMTVGPAISLYFEPETHLLRRSERVFPGFGLVEYRFDNYETRQDIPFNQDFTLYLNGDINLERKNLSLRMNQSLDAFLEVPGELVAVPPQRPDPLARQELADDVWLIGGSGTYALFVDMGDYIFAAGGTAGIPDRIELLREVVDDKPIRYGMMTHHHFDHVVGVRAYEAEGATVIAATDHEQVVREAAENGAALKLELVDKRMKLEGEQVVEIIDIGPTAHSQHLLVAWLPAQGILFEADHFALPAEGPVPPAVSSTRSFADAVARHGLKVQQFVSAHSPRAGTAEDLAKAVKKQPVES